MASFAGITVAVTGGAGFIGATLCDALLRNSDVVRVAALDCFLEHPYDPALKRARIRDLQGFGDRFVLCEGRLEDREWVAAMLAQVGSQLVFHLAGLPNVRICEESRDLATTCNVKATRSVLLACSALPAVRRIIFSSSSCVYGELPTPWSDATPLAALQPRGHYGATKLEAEKLFAQHAEEHAEQTVVVARLFSVYGPRGRPDMIVAKLVDAALSSKSVDINGDGDCRRDFTFVNDIVDGLLLLASASVVVPQGQCLAVNLGRGESVSVSDLITTTQLVFGKPIAVNRRPPNASDLPITLANSSRAHSLGWTPRVSVGLGLRQIRDILLGLPPKPAIVAVVATKNRSHLLAERALASIARQTFCPDRVVVVDDSSDEVEHKATSDAVQQFASRGMPIVLIANSRQPGASGAWNSGIMEAVRDYGLLGRGLSHVYIAVLDDDDEWLPNHLETSMAVAAGTQAMVVGSGLLRVEDLVAGGLPSAMTPPSVVPADTVEGVPLPFDVSLAVGSFLTKNRANIQGSNMFIRLDCFLMAGLFDEGLPCTTDRDMMLRVVMLADSNGRVTGTPLYQHTGQHTVRHYAEDTRVRLSNPGPAKLRGLQRFLYKHTALLQGQEVLVDEFLRRAARFGLEPDSELARDWRQRLLYSRSQDQVAALPPSVGIANELHNSADQHASSLECDSTPQPAVTAAAGEAVCMDVFVVGIISPSSAPYISGLLSDLMAMQSVHHVSVHVIVLENGPRSSDGASFTDCSLDKAAQAVVALGLRVFVVTLEQQVADISAELLPPVNGDPRGCRPIQWTRRALHHYVFMLASQLRVPLASRPPPTPRMVVAIFDDDKRLSPLVGCAAESVHSTGRRVCTSNICATAFELLNSSEAVSRSVGVLLGPDTATPPLPAGLLLRTQLVDIVANTVGLLQQDPDDVIVPVFSFPLSISGTDYFHDTPAAGGAWLETPFFCEWPETIRVSKALERVAAMAQAVLEGHTPFREPFVEIQPPPLSATMASPSYRRGGATFLCDEGLLVDAFNSAPVAGPVHARRSDSVWALVLQRARGVHAAEAPELAVFHERDVRSAAEIKRTLLQTLQSDVFGSASFRALDACMQINSLSPGHAAMPLDQALFESTFDGHVNSRMSQLLANSTRLRGLLHTLENMVDHVKWAKTNVHIQSILDSVREIESRLQPEAVLSIFYVTKAARTAAVAWAKTLLTDVHSTAATKEKLVAASARFFDGYRDAIALQQIERLRPDIARVVPTSFTVEPSLLLSEKLEILGKGGEGVVCRLGSLIVKYCDLMALRGLSCGPLPSVDSRPLPRAILLPSPDARDHPVIVSRFVSGERFSGGHSSALCRLLMECQRQGIVLRNLKLDNMVYQRDIDALAFVDFGSDLRAWTRDASGDAEAVCMVRRAYLLAQWSHRSDLSQLLAACRVEAIGPAGPAGPAWPAGLVGSSHMTGCGAAGVVATGSSGPVSSLPPEVETVECRLLVATILGPFYVDGALYDAILQNPALAPARVPNGCHVLDYGCGKGKLTRRLCDALPSANVVGYDCDANLNHRWESDRVPCTTDWGKISSQHWYDIIVCSRVLCEISSDVDALEMLQRLSAVLSSSGRILLVMCHPFFPAAGETMVGQRCVDPAHASGHGTFSWRRTHSATGGTRTDHRRPWHRVLQLFHAAGLDVVRTREPLTTAFRDLLPTADYLHIELRPTCLLKLPRILPGPDLGALARADAGPSQPGPSTANTVGGRDPSVVLLIKVCAMDAAVVSTCVRHLVRQLEGPRLFSRRIVVVDGPQPDRPRRYADDNAAALQTCLDELKAQHWIDEIVHPPSADAIGPLMCRWLGPGASWHTHSGQGTPLASFFQALELCQADIVLHVDIDIMIYRPMRDDYLGEAVALFERDPHAVTLSLSIAQASDQPFEYLDSAGAPFRTEVRAGILHCGRLLAALPLAAVLEDGKAQAQTGWYRMLDETIRASPSLRSYRGGRATLGFVHPENSIKADSDWSLIRNIIEQGTMLPSQRGCVNLQADIRLWLAAHGSRVIPADFDGAVFILCGRNVSPGKTLRCLQSLCAMAPVAALPWRAVIVDDNSHDELSAFYRLVAARDTRFVLLQTDARRRMLANLVACIRHVVLSPVAIIVTLDLDDALLGTSVLEHVHRLFVIDGVEAAAGGMLNAGPHKTERTTLAVDFSSPRTRRGGRVWAHLRCFRKYLFDAILDSDLRDAQGHYFCYATDWAYMLPIVEMAYRTAALPTHCYFYQPADRQDREDIIGEIVAKPAYARRRLRVAVVGDAGKYAHPDTIAFAVQLGAALAIEGHVLLCGGEGGVMAAVCRGAKTVPNSTTVGLLRTADDNSGNPWLDVVLPIGLGEARNAVLATAAHAVVAVGGGAGTLSEIAHGWTAGHMIIACSSLPGWSSKIGDGSLDQRPRHTGWAAGTCVHPATTPADVVRLLRGAGSGLLRAGLRKT